MFWCLYSELVHGISSLHLILKSSNLGVGTFYNGTIETRGVRVTTPRPMLHWSGRSGLLRNLIVCCESLRLNIWFVARICDLPMFGLLLENLRLLDIWLVARSCDSRLSGLLREVATPGYLVCCEKLRLPAIWFVARSCESLRLPDIWFVA